MAHYFQDRFTKYYYEDIKQPGSLENAVDKFWAYTLQGYFLREEEFAVEQEAYPSSSERQRADVIVRTIRRGYPRVVAILEAKRSGYETRSAEWRDALKQLTAYLKLVRSEQDPRKKEVLYGAVAIGTYVRFYILPAGKDGMVDYVAQSDRPFEVKDNVEDVHQILSEWVELTSR